MLVIAAALLSTAEETKLGLPLHLPLLPNICDTPVPAMMQNLTFVQHLNHIDLDV
jgi:hypothetical protein